MELLNPGIPLMDKIKLKNFDVIELLNFEELEERGIVFVIENAPYYLYTASGKRYSALIIGDGSDDIINSLNYHIDRSGYVCAKLELSVIRDEYHNLDCYSVEEYQQHVLDVQDYLANEYGIIIDIRCLTYLYMEINETIILNDLYENYDRVLKLLMELFPGTLRLKGEKDYLDKSACSTKITDRERKTRTYEKTSGKRGLTITIYDKKKQLEDDFEITVTCEYLRFEIKLNDAKKIKDVFEKIDFWKITDDDIFTYFRSFISDNVEKPYYKYVNMRDIAIRKILKKNYRSASPTWVVNTILDICNHEIKTGLPIILGIEELINCLNVIRFTSKQNKWYTKQRFRKACVDYADNLMQKDEGKYPEIIDKLMGRDTS